MIPCLPYHRGSRAGAPVRKKLNRSKKTKPVHNLKNSFPMMEFWIILTKYKPEFTIFLAPSAPLSVNDYHWFSLGHKKKTQKVPIPSGYDSSIHVLDRRSFFNQLIITSIQFSVTLVSRSAASLAWRRHHLDRSVIFCTYRLSRRKICTVRS